MLIKVILEGCIRGNVLEELVIFVEFFFALRILRWPSVWSGDGKCRKKVLHDLEKKTVR